MNSLILGCGPGRCGSKSLAALLNAQVNCKCSHSCPVTGGKEVKLLELIARESNVSADIAPWWLWKSSSISREIKNAKFIVMWRNIDDIVESMAESGYLDKAPFGRLKNNPRRWIEDYYLETCQLAAKIPNQVRFIDVEDLSDENMQFNLLKWCGFEMPITIPNLHLNRREEQNGHDS